MDMMGKCKSVKKETNFSSNRMNASDVLISLLLIFFCSSLSSQLSLEELINKNQTQELEFEEYSQVIDHFNEQRQYWNGLVYSDKLIDKCKALNDTDNWIKAINYKSGNLIDLGKNTEGIEFCESHLPIFREKDSFQLQLLCFKWGMMYYLDGEFSKAKDIYSKITSKRLTTNITYLNNFSIIHAALLDYDQAIFYLKQIIKDKNIRQKSNISLAFSNLANYNLNLGKPKIALSYLDSAHTLLGNSTDYRKISSLYVNYFHTYKLLGRADESFQTLDSIKKYNDLTFDSKLQEEFQDLKTSYEREKHLKQKVKAVDGKIEQYERQFLLWAIFICMLILLIVFYFFYRNVKAKNKLIVLEQKLLRSQMTPHFIFNSLSVVQGMILNKEDEKAMNYLSKFSKLMRIILENSRSKLVPLEDELLAVQNYLDLQALQMTNKLSYKINIGPNVDPSTVLIPTMLIQPFVENSIEHGFKGEANDSELIINLSSEGEVVSCEIIDNGIGVSKIKKQLNPNKNSVSTAITTERLALLSKQYKLKSGVEVTDRSINNEKGTKVKLTLPKITD